MVRSLDSNSGNRSTWRIGRNFLSKQESRYDKKPLKASPEILTEIWNNQSQHQWGNGRRKYLKIIAVLCMRRESRSSSFEVLKRGLFVLQIRRYNTVWNSTLETNLFLFPLPEGFDFLVDTLASKLRLKKNRKDSHWVSGFQGLS